MHIFGRLHKRLQEKTNNPSARPVTYVAIGDSVTQGAMEHAIPLCDVYTMWEEMEQQGLDIHDRLANGINHPDRQFHMELAEALEKMLFDI